MWFLVSCALDNTPISGDADANDSGPPAPEWTTLPSACTTPADLGEDPIRLRDSVLPGATGGLYEMVDIEVSGGLAFAVGQGGLVVVDATPGAAAVLSAGLSDRFHRVEPIGEGFLALTHRDRGLTVVDVRDPTRPIQVAAVNANGWEGLNYADGRLYVTVRDVGVQVLDVSVPDAPVPVGEGLGLAAPWELSDVRDGWMYAADNTLGVVPIDLSDPDAPRVGDAVDVGGAALHATVAGDWLYVSAGGTGVVVLSLADPAVPEPVATLPTGGSVVMTAVADGLLYAADHVGLAVWDIADPRHPIPVGRESTPQFALGVAAEADVAWVADWTALESWSVSRDARSPDVDVSSTTVRVPADATSAEVTLTNLGGGPLVLSGATTSDPRLTVQVSTAEVAPGGEAIARLTFEGGAPLDATACLATNDPDGPLVELRVGSGADDPAIGQAAPDFVLPDLDGESHRLSEQLGHPVMLVYFATW